jgi:DNA-binding CsgD family transcriptional regulator
MSTHLTRIDLAVIALLAKGHTSLEIGKEFGLTEADGKRLVDAAMYRGLARNRAHLVAIAYQRGLLEVDMPLLTPEPGSVADRLDRIDARRRGAA